MKRIIRAVLVCMLTVGALPSCTTSSGFERRKVTVVDEGGKPISGAATYPQPFVRGEKQSDIEGSLWVYGFSPNAEFRVNAHGYKEQVFKFDQESSRCVLSKSGSQ